MRAHRPPCCVASTHPLLPEQEWKNEDYICVAELFDGEDADGMVELSNISRFGKTAWDSTILTWLVLQEIMYPTLVRATVQQFSCRNDLWDGASRSWLNADLEIACDSPEHIAFMILFAVPTAALFIICGPVGSVLALRRAVKQNGWSDDTTLYRFAVLIGGYRKETWYWSLVVAARKLLMAVISVAMSAAGTKAQYVTAIIVIVAALAVQVHVRPFVNEGLNFMEDCGLVVLFMSMYLGLLFFWESFDSAVLGGIGDFIIVMNVFYVIWLLRGLAINWLHRNSTSVVSQCLLPHEDTRYFTALLFLLTPFVLLWMVGARVAKACTILGTKILVVAYAKRRRRLLAEAGYGKDGKHKTDAGWDAAARSAKAKERHMQDRTHLHHVKETAATKTAVATADPE